ncbi:hypothetical protein [Deinococcus knuensis]|uniref:DUF4139 domain-containing protein n=1 Tax=Deinococcus knuensis TaxID=1837380 RepID=A0ABQ2SX02_9DEIO|nr:hypothetical protein [Deinococcus knuensis]GGS40783.1 hypothetical protein GCM10008961_35150 [Deinococcus knuensis]
MTEPVPPAVELRIYQEFSEIRTLVQSEADHLTLHFPATTWEAIDTRSITLIGLPYTSKTVTARESWLTSFEGRQIGLRTDSGAEDVTLIRAEDLVVQNAAGAYFHARQENLLLPEAPPPQGQRGVVTLTFALPAAGQGVLTYQTGSLTWSAHYRLDIDAQGGGVLRADATLHNRGDLPLEPEAVTLVAGEVKRRRDYDLPTFLSHMARNEPQRLTPSWQDDSDSTPEVAGLYRYQLRNPPRLERAADVTVPFDDVPLTQTRLTNTLYRHMDFTGDNGGAFQRHYRLVTPRPLLAATVTLRDQGYLVGQQAIQETAAGQEVSLTLGQDPNVTYRREVTQLSSTEHAQTTQGRVTDTQEDLQRYWVVYQIRNAGTRHVEYEVTEATRYLTIRSVTGAVKHTPGAVTFSGTVAPATVTTVEFEVVIEND